MLNNATTGTRLSLLVGFLVLIAVGAGMLGINGIGTSNADLKNVYAERLVPLTEVVKAHDLMRDSMQHLTLAVGMHDPANPSSKLHASHSVKIHLDAVTRNIEAGRKTWARYTEHLHGDERAGAETDARLREGIEKAPQGTDESVDQGN